MDNIGDNKGENVILYRDAFLNNAQDLSFEMDPINILCDENSSESGRFNEAYSQANLYVVAISKCQIQEIKGLVEFVPSQDCLYHVKSGSSGHFSCTFKCENLPRSSSCSDYFVRMELRRQAKKGAKVSYEHIPVNKICSQHEVPGISVPIQPVSSSVDVDQYQEEIRSNTRGRLEAYLMKRVQPELEDPSKIVTKLDLWFPCWNKCGTSTFPEVLTSSQKFTKEAARDIYLSVVLVERLNNISTERSEEVRINIWSKEDLCERDLKKNVVRLAKGAASRHVTSRNNLRFLATIKHKLPLLSPEEKDKIQKMLDEDRAGF